MENNEWPEGTYIVLQEVQSMDGFPLYRVIVVKDKSIRKQWIFKEQQNAWKFYGEMLEKSESAEKAQEGVTLNGDFPLSA